MASTAMTGLMSGASPRGEMMSTLPLSLVIVPHSAQIAALTHHYRPVQATPRTLGAS
jgi:hypothetical protein